MSADGFTSLLLSSQLIRNNLKNFVLNSLSLENVFPKINNKSYNIIVGINKSFRIAQNVMAPRQGGVHPTCIYNLRYMNLQLQKK